MARRKSMPEIQDIVRRLRSGQSFRAIRRETGVHRQTIRKVKAVVAKMGWLKSEKLPTEAELQVAVYGESAEWSHPLDNWYDDFKRWVEDGLTYVVMHKLITPHFNCEESTVRRYVKKRFPNKPKATIVRRLIPGEVMEVDFGELGVFYDTEEKRRRKAWVFSARLRYSRQAFRMVCFNQKAETFFEGHIHAFEFFGGVPKHVVPDNTKAAVIKAAFDDPLLNKSYVSLALHYDFLISPTLPYHPHHKGGVENDIKYVKRNFLPLYKESEKRLGQEVPRATGMQAALEKWTNDVSQRVVKGTGRTVVDMFIEEQAALKPLPAFRWQPVTWHQCKVDTSWRIQFARSFYSVPHTYIGQKVEVMASSDTVRIYSNSSEIAAHTRNKKEWSHSIKETHAPPNYQRYLQTTQVSLRQLAERVGPNTLAVANQIFKRRSSDGLRPVRALLSFGKKYGDERLEAACRRAVFYHTPEDQSVKKILASGYDQLPLDDGFIAEDQQTTLRFARDVSYFNL